MSKVILCGYIVVPDSELESVKLELARHIKLTKKEPGCIVFNVTQCVEVPHRFEVYEEFVDETAFELHQKRVQASRWGEVTKNVLRHYNIAR